MIVVVRNPGALYILDVNLHVCDKINTGDAQVREVLANADLSILPVSILADALK